MRFLGNLAASLGPTVCLEVEECVDLRSLLEGLLRSKGEVLSAEELVVTSPDGRPLPGGTTACDVREVRVVRLVRGG